MTGVRYAKDDGVSKAAPPVQTVSEARTDSNWWGKPAGATTPYTLAGHFR